jgi:hypothetical protein
VLAKSATNGGSAPLKPPTIFTPAFLVKTQVIDYAGFSIPGLKYAALIPNPQNGRFVMKYLITGLIVALFSASALAGSAPNPGPIAEVPEPGMLGLFAASVAALFIVRKFRK